MGLERIPKAVYIVLILGIMTMGIFLIFKFGYEPQPVRIMKPSYFNGPEEIGAVAFRRFYAPIEQYGRVVIGVPPQPEFYRDIVRGFLKAAAQEGKPFQTVIAEQRMPDLDIAGIEGLEKIVLPTNTPTQAELIDALSAAKASGKRVLIYTSSVFSTKLLEGNPVNRFESQTDERLLTITTGPLALRHDQEYLLDPICVGSERDGTGTAKLGCTILKTGRWFYRKKLAQDRYLAVMNSPKPEDYLLLVSVPGQDKLVRPTQAPSGLTTNPFQGQAQ